MLIARPFLLLAIALLASAVNLFPSQFGGFREPLARRFTPVPTCDQQVSVDMDFGQERWRGSRRRARC